MTATGRGPGRVVQLSAGAGSRLAHHPAARRHCIAWKGRAATPAHAGARRDALHCSAGPLPPAPRTRIAGRVALRGSARAPRCRRALRTALRRVALHPRARVTDRWQRGAAGQNPRLALGALSPCSRPGRRGATDTGSTVAHRRPRGAAGQHPRLTLVQGKALRCLSLNQPCPRVVPQAVPPLLSGRAASDSTAGPPGR